MKVTKAYSLGERNVYYFVLQLGGFLLMDCWQFPNYPQTYKSQTRDINLLDLFILSVHIRDGVLEANEDAAGDADDEDETEDDEGRNNNQDEQSVVLVRGAETRH